MRQSPAGSVFLPFDFVLAHLQVFFNLRIRQRPMIGTARQKAKIQLPHRYIISVNALKLWPTRLLVGRVAPCAPLKPRSGYGHSFRIGGWGDSIA